MGFELAAESARRGAEVTVIAANVGLEAPTGVRRVDVTTAAELAAACEREREAADVVLMAAAVADLRPVAPVEHKLKKDLRPQITLDLEPTVDILAGLSVRRRPGQVIVGFAAEHGAGAIESGRAKLERKALDAIVVNDISRPGIGFDAAENAVTILSADGVRRDLARTSKRLVAGVVLDEVQRLRASGDSTMEEAGARARAGARSAAPA
jgi:phosphopantothenoylcysteine decarboxylase/phosphopantothenate--cysteine ligase